MGAAVSLSETSGYEVLDTVAVIDIGINTKHNTKCLISY